MGALTRYLTSPFIPMARSPGGLWAHSDPLLNKPFYPNVDRTLLALSRICTSWPPRRHALPVIRPAGGRAALPCLRAVLLAAAPPCPAHAPPCLSCHPCLRAALLVARHPALPAMASLSVLTFDPEGRPIQFQTWLDDLQLYLQSESRDDVSLIDYTSRTSLAPPKTADRGLPVMLLLT
ncbi:unnamed protein product [Closterium sp. NIES-54]